MKKLSLILAVALVAWTWAAPARAAEPEPLYGTWYFLSDSADPAAFGPDMEKIAAMGFNHVMFPGVVRQAQVTSPSVRPPDPQDLELLGRAIDAARAAGLKVSVTGFLIVEDGAWRGTIRPPCPRRWMESYSDAVEPLLRLAADRKVEMFCLASEMETMKAHGRLWREAVKKARALYPGALGYNTNWWATELDYLYLRYGMDWLEGLDFIGVSSYFPLTLDRDPSREQLTAAWSHNSLGLNVLTQFAGLKRRYPKQRLYAWEVGYRSIDGTNRDPSNWGRSAPPDPKEQADCMAAFLAAFGSSGLDGFAVWSLDPGLQPSVSGYDFYGKPAQTELEKIFRSHRAD